MQTIFLQQDNTFFYHRSSFKELHDFHDLNNFLTFMHVLFLQYCKVHIRYLEFRAIDLLFNSSFFQSFLCNGKLISFQLYWSIEGLIFDILYESFTIFLWFNATVTAYWKNLLSLFLEFIVDFCFLTIQENLYMTHLYLDLYFIKIVMQYISTIKNKFTSFHWFF